jgi:hypothetical protein
VEVLPDAVAAQLWDDSHSSFSDLFPDLVSDRVERDLRPADGNSGEKTFLSDGGQIPVELKTGFVIQR